MNAEHRTIAPADLARPADGASIFRPWRRSDALRAGVLAATVALAGCAGMAGTAAPPTAVTQNPAAPFSAGVGLIGSSPLRLGDAVFFTLSTSATGHGHLYLLNASGTVVALAENLLVAPDAPVVFPAPDAGFTIRARPPVGTNRVLFLVTRQPLQGFGGAGATGAPVTLPVQGDAFVTNLNAATARLPEKGWALAETRVEVVAAGG